MGRYDLITVFELDPESAYVWALVLGAGLSLGASTISFFFLWLARRDWRREFMYKPSLPMMLNLSLLASRLFYLLSVEMIMTNQVDDWRCYFQAIFTQFFDAYVCVLLFAMVWSTSADAISIMVEYPDSTVSREYLSQLLRLSVGGALGTELDRSKLADGVLVSANAVEAQKSRARRFGEKLDEERGPGLTRLEEEKRRKEYQRVDDLYQEHLRAEAAERGEEAGTAGSTGVGRIEQVSMRTGDEATSSAAALPMTTDDSNSNRDDGNATDSTSVADESVDESGSLQGGGKLYGGNSDDDGAPPRNNDNDDDEYDSQAGSDFDSQYDSEFDSQYDSYDSQYDSYDSQYDSEYDDESSEESDFHTDSDSEEETETDEDDEAEQQATVKQLLDGCFGFFCGGADVPAAAETKAQKRQRLYRERMRQLGIKPEDLAPEDDKTIQRSASFKQLQSKLDSIMTKIDQSELASSMAESEPSMASTTSRKRGGRRRPAPRRGEFSDEDQASTGAAEDDARSVASSRRSRVSRARSRSRLSRRPSMSRIRSHSVAGPPSRTASRRDSVFSQSGVSDTEDRRAPTTDEQEGDKGMSSEAMTGMLSLTYPSRVAEMIRQFVTRPVVAVTDEQLREGYLRPASRWECTKLRKFISKNLRRSGKIAPAHTLTAGFSTHVLCFLVAAAAAVVPAMGNGYGYIGYTCSIQEGGVGITFGKTVLLLVVYVPYWATFFISQVLHFSLRLVKSFSYPATANGPHHLETTILRLTWYPTTMAISFIFPSAHAFFWHQHETQDVQSETYLGAIFHMWSLQMMAVFCALGLLVVENHIGKRDRAIVRLDPLAHNKPARVDGNLEEMPVNNRLGLARDRFWLLMNVVEDRKHTSMGGGCPRCQVHSHRLNIRAHLKEMA